MIPHPHAPRILATSAPRIRLHPESAPTKKGCRPAKGQNLAIAEWPTESGPADYALFIGLQLMAIVEAKRDRRKVSAALEQAKRYARGIQIHGDETLAGTWPAGEGDYKGPFLLSTNGRPFFRQLIDESGAVQRPHDTI